MAHAETQVNTSEERRRSERLPLALPLVVRGESLDTNAFQEETFTLSVSAHGALLALVTTVTLGQRLFLRNQQTQDEAVAWVTRLGLPRGGFAQVGVEFVQPDTDFWSNKSRVKPAADGADRRNEDAIRALPHPGGKSAFEAFSSDGREVTPQAQATSPDKNAATTLAPPNILLNALEQVLREAVDQAVATAATTRLSAAVNQGAAVIQHFSKVRARELEERLVQYRQELVSWAREDFVSRLHANVARAEEYLQKRAEAFIEDAARSTHGDFAKRLRETANQAVVQFVEDANHSSAQRYALIAGQIQATTREARTRIETTVAEFNESEKKTRDEMERTVAETQQRVQSLTSQLNRAYADCESRLRAFQEELAHTKEQEVEHFRERLRNVLTSLLSSLK